MVELGIAGKCGRKLPTTWRDKTAKPAPDRVERDFRAEKPDDLWAGDVTYIPTGDGWLFVASVLEVGEADAQRATGRSDAGPSRTKTQSTIAGPTRIITSAGRGGPELVPCCWQRGGPIGLASDNKTPAR